MNTFADDVMAGKYDEALGVSFGDAAYHVPDNDFIIGDIVSLIVGGPDMVVLDVCDCGGVEVAWADSDGDVCIDVFPEEALVSHE